MRYSPAALAPGLICAVAVALAGCSGGGSLSTPTPGSSATSQAPTAAATQPTQASSPSSPAASGVLKVSITGLPATPSLGYGTAPLQFGVTISNGTASTYHNITVLVWINHCTCLVNPIVPGAPNGTLQAEDTATGQWHSVTYDSAAGGMDYLLSVQQFPGITLGPGATDNYTLRIAFNPKSAQTGGPGRYAAGSTSLNATLVALPGHTVIGSNPAASIPLTVTNG